MKQKKTIISVVFLLLGIGGLNAQEAVLTTGGDASGTGGTVSYSVGQVVYKTDTGTNGSMTQGVQQPFEISIITELEGTKEINLSVKAYPNPTTNYLTLDIEGYKTSDLSYQLYDINGKLIKYKKIEGNRTDISMNNLIPATYFIKVVQNNKEVKAFKIVKN